MARVTCTTDNDDNSSSSSDGLLDQLWFIIVIAGGGGVVLIAFIIGICWCHRQRMSRDSKAQSAGTTSPASPRGGTGPYSSFDTAASPPSLALGMSGHEHVVGLAASEIPIDVEMQTRPSSNQPFI